jgi:predicted O-methyltransferase YrrM
VTYEEVVQGLAGWEYPALTAPDAGKLLYDFVATSGVEDVLELGFAHGTSTAYMAAALAEKGVGSVTTIDRASALSREPNIHQVLGRLGLASRVQLLCTASSYNWELMRILERQTTGGETSPCFDFCFIDGAHTWETDGFAFLLVDKLLRHDRWVLFDDMHWSLAASPSMKAEKLHMLSEDELKTPQVEQVFDLLVRAHPEYGEFVVTGSYGWAYKRPIEGEGRHRRDVERIVGPELLRQLLARRRQSAAPADRVPPEER